MKQYLRYGLFAYVIAVLGAGCTREETMQGEDNATGKIIITGSIWQGAHDTDQMRMGLSVKPEEAQARLRGFAARPEWKTLEAVRTGEVYGVDHGSLRSMLDYTYLMDLAKILYPKTFSDFDPQAEFDTFWKTYLPEVDASGTFFIKLER